MIKNQLGDYLKSDVIGKEFKIDGKVIEFGESGFVVYDNENKSNCFSIPYTVEEK
jgi:hypothetical protein